MARIRTVKPEFTQDEELSSLPAEIHLFAAGLICYADDYGYFNANPLLVKSAIFPLRETLVDPPEFLRKLREIGFIELFEGTDGKKYGHIVKFDIHQRVSHPTESKIKPLRKSPENLGDYPDVFVPEGKGKERGKEHGKEGNGTECDIETDFKKLGEVWEKGCNQYRAKTAYAELIAKGDKFETIYNGLAAIDSKIREEWGPDDIQFVPLLYSMLVDKRYLESPVLWQRKQDKVAADAKVGSH